MAQKLLTGVITAAGVWYKGELFMNAGPDSFSNLRCEWDHIKSMCASQTSCGYCLGSHRTIKHQCNIVGCTSKQAALCSLMQEIYRNYKGNHIAFSGRCARMADAVRVAQASNSEIRSRKT